MQERRLNELLAEHLKDPGFAKAVLSGPVKSGGPDSSPWEKVTIRVVELQRGRQLQIVRFDEKRSDTKTVDPDDPLVAETVQLNFRHLTVQSETALFEYRETKKGKVFTTQTDGARQVSTAHDRQKARMIPENAQFLEILGLASGGSVKPNGQRKYRQINEFVRAVAGSPGIDEILQSTTIRIVDLGCGNAYLTFAIFHYLHEILGLPCQVRGIDRDRALMERANQRAKSLGWLDLSFAAGNILDTAMVSTPQIVIALHACDTATDDAIARAVEWGSPLVLVAPCCQHDIQAQMQSSSAPAGYSSIVRKGLLKERLGDLLTDTFRCDLLGLMGYQSDVIEFVSLEHTAKNLMIRAGHTGATAVEDRVQQYTSLRDQWNVTPHLERLLSKQLTALGVACSPTFIHTARSVNSTRPRATEKLTQESWRS